MDAKFLGNLKFKCKVDFDKVAFCHRYCSFLLWVTLFMLPCPKDTNMLITAICSLIELWTLDSGKELRRAKLKINCKTTSRLSGIIAIFLSALTRRTSRVLFYLSYLGSFVSIDDNIKVDVTRCINSARSNSDVFF